MNSLCLPENYLPLKPFDAIKVLDKFRVKHIEILSHVSLSALCLTTAVHINLQWQDMG